MKTYLKLLVCSMFISTTSFAQLTEKPFTGYPTSQLQFSTYYLQYPKVKFENPFREISSARAFGFQSGIGYYQALKYGFGVSIQAQMRIQNARFDLIDFYFDASNGDTVQIPFKNRIIMPLFATPIMIEKDFVLRERHWLNAAIGVGITYFPYEALINAVAYERFNVDSSGYGEGVNYFYYQPEQKFALDYRFKLGYKYMLPSQNTISANLNYSYSPFSFIDAQTNRILNENLVQSGHAAQSLSYFGLELTYAYSFRKQEIGEKNLGEIKPEKEEAKKDGKFWVETGISFLQIRQKIKYPNPYFETAFYPQAKFNLAVELNKKWNQRYAFSYLRYWEVGPSVTIFPFGGAGAGGIDPTFFLSSTFGKDLVKTKRERFKIKPWVGGAISLFPYSFTDRKYGDDSYSGYGSSSYQGDTLSFINSHKYPNLFNLYLSAAMEFELSLFRTMKFSITPGYTQGLLKNSVSNYQYTFNGTETGNFKLISRLSHPELKFALKIPIYYRKRNAG